MINIMASNNLTLADCLGGYKSLQTFPAWIPIVTLDQIRCLFIDSLRIAGGYDLSRAEFTITKSGDDFTLSITYPTAAVGWTVVSDIEFTLEIDDVYQSTSDLADIRIRRVLTGADGTMQGRIALPYNNPLGGADLDISAGTVTRYGCMFLEVEDATYIETITSYAIIEGTPVAASCQIALQTDAINTQRIASTTTAPTGLSLTNTETISGNLAAGTYALWYKTISSGAIGDVTNVILIDQSAGGDTESLAIIGRHRRYDATLDGYVMYGAYDGSVTDGTEIDTFAALPGTVDLPLPGAGTRDYLLRVVARNKYGIESQNVLLDHAVTVNAAGADVTVPQTPSNVALTFLNGGNAKLEFDYAFDTLEPVIYAQVEIATEDDRGMVVSGFSTYTARTLYPVLWGESITARVRFVDRLGRIGAWATVTETALFSPASLPLKSAMRTGGISAHGCSPDYYASYESGDAVLTTEPGRVSFYYDGVLEFYAQWNDDNALVLYLGDYALVNESVSGAQTDTIEDVAGVVYISDGTTRRVKIDTNNKTFGAVTFLQEITQCRREDALATVSNVKYFQCYPTSTNSLRAPEPWLALSGENVYLTTIGQS